MDKIRCSWVTSDPLYIAYHDEEWGRECRQSNALFAMLCLEGQQAGLSWLTVLKKRQHYYRLFADFEPLKIAQFSTEKVEQLLLDSDIIRNRLKINAIISNAQAYIKMQENDEDFSTFIWAFVDHKPIINHWQTISDVPAKTAISTAMSCVLKKKGFKFVGSTICYAFMQACGLVNDHIQTCYCYTSS